MLLDTVSSFGGEFIDFANWNIAACAATANKCLHGVPGIAFVLVQRSILDAGVSGATSVYLDLFRYYQEQERGSTPFTQSVQVCYALAEALREECPDLLDAINGLHFLAFDVGEKLFWNGFTPGGITSKRMDPAEAK